MKTKTCADSKHITQANNEYTSYDSDWNIVTKQVHAVTAASSCFEHDHPSTSFICIYIYICTGIYIGLYNMLQKQFFMCLPKQVTRRFLDPSKLFTCVVIQVTARVLAYFRGAECAPSTGNSFKSRSLLSPPGERFTGLLLRGGDTTHSSHHSNVWIHS